MDRRAFLAGLAALTSTRFAGANRWTQEPGADPGADPYLEAARNAARWIRSTERSTDAGPAWPADSADPTSIQPALYHGVCGPTLFALAWHSVEPADEALAMARSGADYLAQSLETLDTEQLGAGLYTGLGGVAYTLFEAARVEGLERFRSPAVAATREIVELAREQGGGIEWSASTDIISGNAGTMLFCLDALRRGMEEELASRLDAAVRASGDRLCEIATERGDGLDWFMTPDYERRMPNFSHGTAGVAYALAQLHRHTGDDRYLDAALAGGRHLKSIADERCFVHHHSPGGEELFYLGWCHGPTGTGRLYHVLHALTEEASWREELEAGARSLLDTGIPEARPDGFWNNVGVCCGSAGVAEYLLDVHALTEEQALADRARVLLDDVVARGTRDDAGLHWVQAEHRVRPDFLQAQTGYMQGAAGVGIVLLRQHQIDRGMRLDLRLPDSPFA